MSRSTLLKQEYLFLISLLTFSFTVRVFPHSLITIITLITFISLISYSFYLYALKAMSIEQKLSIAYNYTWGFVRLPTMDITVNKLKTFLLSKEYAFYKKFILINVSYIIIGLFIFADLLIAFKNLNIKTTGVYIALSIFTKFVFISVYLLNNYYKKNEVEQNVESDENRIKTIFTQQMNSYLSMFALIFIVFFLLSKYIVEIFFGYSYLPYQSTLPFVLLANISLAVLYCLYITAIKLDAHATNKILKIYALFFSVLFIFMNIDYIDLIAYFVIGMSTLLSILLFNFVIKKPEYIRNTYNLLF